MKTTRLEIRLSELMREEWRKAANHAGLSVSEWVIMRCSGVVRTDGKTAENVVRTATTNILENQVVTHTKVASLHRKYTGASYPAMGKILYEYIDENGSKRTTMIPPPEVV
jgi:uncharacterized protein (DUF1778 family)